MSCPWRLDVSSQNWCTKKLHLSFIPVKARSYSSPTSKPLDQLYIFSNDWTSLYVITSPPCWSYLQPDFHKDYFFVLYNERKVRLRAQSQCCMSFLGNSNTEHPFSCCSFQWTEAHFQKKEQITGAFQHFFLNWGILLCKFNTTWASSADGGRHRGCFWRKSSPKLLLCPAEPLPETSGNGHTVRPN